MAHPSIHGIGAAFHLRLATWDNITTSSTSPTSPALSSVQIFSQNTDSLLIFSANVCCLSTIFLQSCERPSPPLLWLVWDFPFQTRFPACFSNFLISLPSHFHHSFNKHGVEHYIVTHGPRTHARDRRLDLEKLSAAKSEFLQMEEMGIVRRSKSTWSSPLYYVPKSDGKW
ncbi:retrovirus-related pol polyprotein [Plakobranchus ocellatus]|uniref:Retrovirus-related pol polyprotein n=1 Tax=Plakobranchus ocellatus TaxID=259542 RepID=A0AAV4B0V4_9GAST|nr:retrovirus-related pol polyprotein [Plakobranchus ocellatus]